MNEVRFRIDSYIVQIFAADLKGRRRRWGDKVIKLFSAGKEIGQAVFAQEGEKILEPFFSSGVVHYFAPGSQFASVMKLLEAKGPAYIVWKPTYDPKEPNDGDAYFCTDQVERKA